MHRTMTRALAELMAKAIVTYGFRVPTERDAAGAYLRALIDHVAERDLAAAHELRLGKPQADWTPADVHTFQAAITRGPGPKRAFAPGELVEIQAVMIDGFTATEADLRQIAAKGLASMMERRVEHASAELPIYASVLTVTGDLVTTTVNREDRVAVLKMLAQQTPAFGFILVFDAFIHRINDNRTATKTDALLAQVGTRDMRITMQRPYRFVKGCAVFDDPPPPDIDMRDHVEATDPYAEIFVSVSASDTPQ